MINFMKWKWLYFAISLVVIIPGVISLIFFGFKQSIDFTGGTILQVMITPKENQSLNEETIKQSLGDTLQLDELRTNKGLVTLRTKPIDIIQKEKAITALQRSFKTVEEVSFETVGPTLGKELLTKTLIAMLLSAGGITLYVAYRFSELKYGVCAVLAMLHDSLVLLGIFSLFGKFLGVQVDTLFVTAVLTILSFSVHDTIVVYDRIRELRKKSMGLSYVDVINTAVTETMSRSINNSMAIIFMLFVLWLLGGDSMKWFALALLIGTITGTYSSTFTAAPLLVVWSDIIGGYKRRKKGI